MAEILKDCLWVHEQHLEKHDNEAGIWDFSLMIMNHYMEYTIYEFRDQKAKQKVELTIYYRFSSYCSLLVTQPNFTAQKVQKR